MISAIICADPSTMAASTTLPLPVRPALMIPASIPATRYSDPPPISPTSVGGVIGGCPGAEAYHSAPESPI